MCEQKEKSHCDNCGEKFLGKKYTFKEGVFCSLLCYREFVEKTEGRIVGHICPYCTRGINEEDEKVVKQGKTYCCDEVCFSHFLRIERELKERFVRGERTGAFYVYGAWREDLGYVSFHRTYREAIQELSDFLDVKYQLSEEGCYCPDEEVEYYHYTEVRVDRFQLRGM